MRRMNWRERRLVKRGLKIRSVKSFIDRTGVSLKDAHAEMKRVLAKQCKKSRKEAQ